MKEIGEAKEVRDYIFHLEGSPVDQALAIDALMLKGKMNQSEIAKVLGWSTTKISARLQFLQLHNDLRVKLRHGEIGTETAHLLSTMKRKDQERFAARDGPISLEEVRSFKRNLFMSTDIMELLEQPFEKLRPERSPRCCPSCKSTKLLHNPDCVMHLVPNTYEYQFVFSRALEGVKRE